MSFFEAAVKIVLGVEKGFQKDPHDKGNWTSGKVGVGELRGTKGGISAAAYPNLDIEHLTDGQINDLYQRDYWNPCGCERMPWERALCVFDCAVNEGVGVARSLSAIARDVEHFMADRANRYAKDPTFGRYGEGWDVRLFTVFKAAQVTPP